MKIVAVDRDNRRQAFVVRTRRTVYSLPFSECDPAPTRTDPPAHVSVDDELGNEAFTYRLESGSWGTVHIDAVLEYNEDPDHMAELALYQLSAEARDKFDSSPLSAREIARRLGTSPAQVYRLLDPTNYSKSLKQMVSLLYVLGYDLGLAITPRPRALRPRLVLPPRGRRLGRSAGE